MVQTGPLILFIQSAKKNYIFFLPVEFPLLKAQWGVSMEGEVLGSYWSCSHPSPLAGAMTTLAEVAIDQKRDLIHLVIRSRVGRHEEGLLLFIPGLISILRSSEDLNHHQIHQEQLEHNCTGSFSLVEMLLA